MAEMASVRAASGGSSRTYVAPDMVVRRLLPVECCRLQSVPDNHFDGVLYHGKPLADGPKYKLLGNGFCVNVVSWIGKRIQMVEDLKGKN
jgi:DNA (cytosine-5)-methyltransferase 1